METVCFASGKTITLLTGWRSMLFIFAATLAIGFAAIAFWEIGKSIGRSRNRTVRIL